jgi:hypothetical protein
MRTRAYTPKDREEAIAKTEQLLIRPNNGNGGTATITLPVSQLKTLPELFQPRSFGMG